MAGPRIGIFLRLDEAAGLGHWGRCQPLAKALAAAGAEPHILVQRNSGYLKRVAEAGLPLRVTPPWEPPVMGQVARELGLVGAVLDYHGIRRDPVHALREQGVIVLALAIQDADLEAVDLVANPAAPSMPGKPVFSGPQAAIVDEEALAPLVGQARPDSGAVILALGGSRLGTARTRDCVSLLTGCPGLRRLDVFAMDDRGMETVGPRVHWHPLDRPGFLSRLAGASLLVCGYGTSLFEAARLGVPALVVPLTPQHAQHAARLQEAGFFRLLAIGPDFAVSLREEAGRLLHDASARATTSHAGREAVDGTAAPRIAAWFLTHLGVDPNLESIP